jgi:Flp pilus assembly protein TadD/predicted aspartyl protease
VHVSKRTAAAVAVSIVLVSTFALHATSFQSVDIQLQLGHLLFSDGRYVDALDAYQRALAATDNSQLRQARFGVVKSALMVAEFDLARREAEKLYAASPRDPEAISLYGDSRWASGLFEEAETRYRDALAIDPDQARAHHGLARSLMARSRLDEALNQAQIALKAAPRDLEMHHTVASIYERMHRFSMAAAAFTNYVNLLPNKDRSDKAIWSRAEIQFLNSFGDRVPFDVDRAVEDQVYTIPFRLVNEKIIVRAKVNAGRTQDFVIDTGSDTTVISGRTAEHVKIRPVTYTLSAGVGEAGLRGLQLARIDLLEIGPLSLRNVPCIIKGPPESQFDLPSGQIDSLSPIALGFSMIVDYKNFHLTIARHLPAEPADFELPMRLFRLATVRGTVDGVREADFVIDTGGEVISISQSTATALGRPEPKRKLALKVWGTSGWDRDAFLMPGVDLTFDAIKFRNYPVVVLNLKAPSALLGFQLGGIVGHRFLSKYRVTIDLDDSVLRLKEES